MSDVEKSILWSNDRPLLKIERGGGSQLGNCYYSSGFTVTSTTALDQEDITALRELGFLGGGQEFYIKGQVMPDGKLGPVPKRWAVKDDWQKWKERQDAEPSGYDLVPPTVRDDRTGKILNEIPKNRYSGKPTLDCIPHKYFVYVVEARTDSGG